MQIAFTIRSAEDAVYAIRTMACIGLGFDSAFPAVEVIRTLPDDAGDEISARDIIARLHADFEH